MKSTAAFILALLMTVSLGAQNASQLVNLRHWSGQGVAPVYEGFDINPDGSYNMWFGYMNRNYEEELDLPVGPDNSFEPGGDRGQPTHFTPRRHKDVFKVTVPKDFGDGILQAVVDDGSGESAGNFGYHCCWTNAQVKVSVKGQGTEVATGDRGRREGRRSPAGTEITFAKDVAPIFQKSCQTCHHPDTS